MLIILISIWHFMMGTWIIFLCSCCERAINILTVGCKTNRKSSVLRFRFESENWTCTSDKPAQAYNCITANLHGLPLPLFACSYRFIPFVLCHSLSPVSLSLSFHLLWKYPWHFFQQTFMSIKTMWPRVCLYEQYVFHSFALDEVN